MREIEIKLVPPSLCQAFGIHASSRDCGRVGDNGCTKFKFVRPEEFKDSPIQLIFNAGFDNSATIDIGTSEEFVLQYPITQYNQFDLQLKISNPSYAGMLVGNRDTRADWFTTPIGIGLTSKLTVEFTAPTTGVIVIRRNDIEITRSNLTMSTSYEYTDLTEAFNQQSIEKLRLDVLDTSGSVILNTYSFRSSENSTDQMLSNVLKFYLTPSLPQYPSSENSNSKLQSEFLIHELLHTSISVATKPIEIDDHSSEDHYILRCYNYYGDEITSLEIPK